LPGKELPNYFGLALTDFMCGQICSTYTGKILFEAYGSDGKPKIIKDSILFGKRDDEDTTSEDTFVGIYYKGGIKIVKMEYTNTGTCGGPWH